MSAFLDEIRSTLVRSLGINKNEEVTKEDKERLRNILGLNKGQMQNIYLRNENETTGKDISIVQVLIDKNIKTHVIDYIRKNVSSTKKCVPDLNVWGIKNYPKELIGKDGYEPLAMDDKFIVKVKPEMVYNDDQKSFCATGRHYMRIYFRY